MGLFSLWVKVLFFIIFILFNICFVTIILVGRGENSYIRVQFFNKLKGAAKYIVFLFVMFSLGVLINYLIH